MMGRRIITDDRFPIKFFAMALVLTWIVLMVLGWYAYNTFSAGQSAHKQDLHLQELQGAVIHLDEVLTMSASMFAATGTPRWAERYRIYEAEFKDTVRKARDLFSNHTKEVQWEWTERGKLLEIENLVLRVAKQGYLEEARQLLGKEEYREEKRVFAQKSRLYSQTSSPEILAQNLRDSIIHLDEVLTMSARMAAATGDLRWEERYRIYEPRLEEAIKQAKNIVSYNQKAAAQTDAANVKLVDMENTAFALVRQDRLRDATAILVSEKYERQKQIYADGMAQFSAMLRSQVSRNIAAGSQKAFLASLGIFTVLSMVVLSWFGVLRTLQRWQLALVDSNRHLAGSKARFSGILEIAHEGIISISEKQEIIIFNNGAERIFGYSEREVVGKPLDILLPKRFQTAHRSEVVNFSNSPQMAKVMGERREIRGRRKNGDEFPAEASVSKLELDGEKIFTVVLRDIADRKQAEAALHKKTGFVRLLQEVAVASNEAMVIAEAMQETVDKICLHTGWPVGHVYELAEDATGELVPGTIWHLDDAAKFKSLQRVTMETRFAPGAGLPGRILAGGRPEWITDVTKNPKFIRAKSAPDIGVKAAFGFPVFVGKQVVAVLEFFSEKALEPDEHLLEVMAHIGTQLGRVVERVKARESIQKRANLEKLISSISTHFMELPVSELSSGVNFALQKMGEFAGADRGYLYVFSDNGMKMEHAYEWCTEGTKPQTDRNRPIASDASAWFKRLMNGQETVIIPGASGLPSEAESEKLLAQGAQSLVNVPIARRGTVIGFLGFDAVNTKRTWCEEDITLLKVTGEMFVNALDRKEIQEALAEQATRDTLTELYNRRYFNRRIVEEISRADRNGQVLAILLCDLDGFKAINDEQGHYVGDEVLKQVAKSIKESTRGSDLIFRWGGDEIVVVLQKTTRDGLLVATDRIREGVRKLSQDGLPNIDVSIGAALYPEHGTQPDDLIRLADRALYIAKKGGEKVHIGEEEYRLDEQAVKVVFQPVVDVRLNQILGYEALSRDPQGKQSILGLFKKYHAVGRLYELKCLCFRLQIKTAREARIEKLFLNVDFNVLKQVEIPPKPHDMEVVLEISESEALQDVEEHLSITRKWRANGYKFAMDDFGAGFISLPFISRLIPDYIKLDRSTLLQAVASGKFRAILKDLLWPLRKCSTDGIIAEGIETEKELGVVKDLGIYLVQGFLFGKPKELN